MTADLQTQLQTSLGTAYTLERELGGGGMSRVFVAEDTRLQRKVVVKVLSPELGAALSMERFEREIRVAASLQQANIVPVLAAGDANGLPYFTMPFVQGESLRKRLTEGPALIMPEVVRILGDVARALAYAHEQGVVHRDIKPDNVLLSAGTAVVTDFGIAKAISAARTAGDSATLTEVGTSIGTPAYMAPEQAAGQPDVDHRADIYAFGCMAYELLAGRPPFEGGPAHRILAAHISQAPVPVEQVNPAVPASLATLVMRCLAKDADDRPRDAAELTQLLDGVTSGVPPASPGDTANWSIMLRRALVAWVVSSGVVLLLARIAVSALGLPDWVLSGAGAVMLLGLPVILLTAYVHRASYRALAATPTRTPGGGAQVLHAGAHSRRHVARPLRAARSERDRHESFSLLAGVQAAPAARRRAARGGGLQRHRRGPRGGQAGRGGLPLRGERARVVTPMALVLFALSVSGFMILRAMGIGPAGSLIAAGKLSDR